MLSNNNQNAAEKYNCTSQMGTTSEKFIWTIENFSQHKEMKCGECLPSTEFITTTPKSQILKWRMRMYPNGDKEESKDYVSFFLHRIDSNNEEVEAKYQISIRKSDGKEFLLGVTKGYRKFGSHGWGLDKLIKREDLFNEKNGYLDGDRLTIVCKLMVQQKSVKNVEVPECRMQEDVSSLFETNLHWDCKIISDAGKKEFEVHKNILGCRSPVFGAMFQHQMTENNDNIIRIPDIKGVVIEKMLRFIYSGKEPDYGGMTGELLIAADKYELIRLKLFCERKLIDSLGIANACAMLILANLHSAEQLKASALDFINEEIGRMEEICR